MQEKSVFTKIIDGEIPAHKIYEDDQVIAILDVHPISDGHTLVIPKKQIDHIWDLEDSDYQYLWQISKKIAEKLRSVINPTRVGVVVEGFGVPHTHVHLIPIYHSNDLKKFQDHNSTPDHEKLAQLADKLRF